MTTADAPRPTPRLLLATVMLGLVGCGQVTVPEEATPTTLPTPTTPAPASTLAGAAPVTLVLGTTTTRATTTTRPLTRAEADAKLCNAVAEADERIQRGSFVAGGLRLGGGIGSTERTATPAVVAGARSMLRAGLDGSPESYVTARQTTSAACARAGAPIQLGGPIMCVQAPCP